MNSNIGIIDLGSNLTKVIIVKNQLPLAVIHRSIYDTKTLKNAPKGHFDQNSISLIERDIIQILEVTKEFNCAHVLGIATSSFRTRTNGQETLDFINSKFGTQIEIIEGSREAFLIYQGANTSVPKTSTPVLVMDIGGGSTEFIIGQGKEILWKQSFDFGSTALTKGMITSDPLKENELLGLRSLLNKMLVPLFKELEKYNPQSFIGTTGAFESFSQIIQLHKGIEQKVKSGFQFSKNEITPVLASLIASNLKQRKNTKGIHPLRVDTIHIAAIIFEFLLSRVSFNTMALSLGDVKEGLALEFIQLESSEK
ncbi:MAG: hypothetical protein ACPGVC_10400 [Salibacteraceae bacterium]